jgi:hypothetical protein
VVIDTEVKHNANFVIAVGKYWKLRNLGGKNLLTGGQVSNEKTM